MNVPCEENIGIHYLSSENLKLKSHINTHWEFLYFLCLEGLYMGAVIHTASPFLGFFHPWAHSRIPDQTAFILSREKTTDSSAIWNISDQGRSVIEVVQLNSGQGTLQRAKRNWQSAKHYKVFGLARKRELKLRKKISQVHSNTITK